MSNASNHHGEWITRHTPKWREYLERLIGSVLPDSDSRFDALYGPPHPGIPQCTYCGSLAPEDFVRLIQLPDTQTEVADWKYGWPHKVYVTIPNPKPDEQRKMGTAGNGEPLWGTYPKLHLKFYTEHLRDWDGLAAAADIIREHTGVMFDMHEGKLRWRAVRPSYWPAAE